MAITNKLISSVVILFASSLRPVAAQTNTPAPAAAAPPGDWIQQAKHPVSWLNWGGDLRVRNEYFNNALTLNPNNPLHEQDYFRFRTRIWAGITPVDDLSFNLRLATEPREWLNQAGYTPFKGRTGLDMTEGVIDNLNVQWKNPLGLPASLTVGRQDILLGDGWLVGDGTPYDGSWTYFLDAARFTYELKEQHTTIEAIGILQNAKDDSWLPTIGNDDRYLTEQSEKGVIFSLANTTLRAANFTGYFIYKHDDAASNFRPADPAPRGGDNADIYTVGGRATGLLGEHWKYSVEGAYQFGQKQDVDIHDAAYFANTAVKNDFRTLDAFGANTKLTYLFKDRLNNQIGFAYEFLSGDDPNSKNDEMFDLLWGCWPRWSELYNVYGYAAETRVAQTANLHRFGPGWACTPIQDLDFSLTYNALFADQSAATRAAPGLIAGNGSFRGHYLQSIVKYKFNPHVSGHLWGEVVFPGSYYVHPSVMTFLRAEVLFTF